MIRSDEATRSGKVRLEADVAPFSLAHGQASGRDQLLTIAALPALRDQVIAPILVGIRSRRQGRKPVTWTRIGRRCEPSASACRPSSTMPPVLPPRRNILSIGESQAITVEHRSLAHSSCSLARARTTSPVPLFCENETNTVRLFGAPPATPYPAAGHALSEGRDRRPCDQRRGHRQPRSAGHQVRVPVPADGRARRDRRNCGCGGARRARGAARGRARQPRSAAVSTEWCGSAGPKPTSSTPS